MKNKLCGHWHPVRFTLIELLVVIATLSLHFNG